MSPYASTHGRFYLAPAAQKKPPRCWENIGDPKAEAEAGGAETSTADGDSTQSSTAQRKGDGRNGAQAYTGGNKVQVPHTSLKRGDLCPERQTGKLYESKTPGVLVRVTGQAPLAAIVIRTAEAALQ